MNNKEAYEAIQQGQSLLFTFKHEATIFAQKMKLKITYHEADFIDDERYEVEDYGTY